MDKKYIIIDKKYPVAFSPFIEHVDETAGRNATSAGFYEVSVDEAGEIQVRCYGYSTSLKGLKSNPRVDSILLKKALFGD